MTREAVLRRLAGRLRARVGAHPLRVGIDGPQGVGKTAFAVELARVLLAAGPVLRIDSDGFHHVRAVRYRQGRESARGYYEDAYDLDALRDQVLVPLGGVEPYRVATRVHDLVTDAVVHEEVDVPAETVVLFDATFLQRGALRAVWDEVVYLDAPPSVARARGVRRDAAAMGGVDRAIAAYRDRYGAAFEIYAEEERPRERASILLDHADPAAPRVLRWEPVPDPGASRG